MKGDGIANYAGTLPRLTYWNIFSYKMGSISETRRRNNAVKRLGWWQPIRGDIPQAGSDVYVKGFAQNPLIVFYHLLPRIFCNFRQLFHLNILTFSNLTILDAENKAKKSRINSRRIGLEVNFEIHCITTFGNFLNLFQLSEFVVCFKLHHQIFKQHRFKSREVLNFFIF